MPEETKKAASKKAAPGTREYDPMTGKFLDGPHPEDYEDEPTPASEPEPAKEAK